MLKSSLLVTLVLAALAGFHSPKAKAMGQGRVGATVTPTPVPTDGSSLHPIAGADTCTSADPEHLCLGLKLVSYTQKGIPVLNQSDAIKLVRDMNDVWSQCNIGFQLETYQAIDPATVGQSYDVNWKTYGDAVRDTFNDNSSFLVVSVGTLSGATIGVTEMPGAGSYGSLIENTYASNALTVGHELGHYMGLYHVNGSDNLMYAYIGAHTATLTADQCTTARTTNQSNWKTILRY